MLGIIEQLAVFLQNTFFAPGIAGVWSESNLRTVVFLRHPKQMPDNSFKC